MYKKNHGELAAMSWLMGALGAWLALVSAFVAFKHIRCGCNGYAKISQADRLISMELPHSGPS